MDSVNHAKSFDDQENIYSQKDIIAEFDKGGKIILFIDNKEKLLFSQQVTKFTNSNKELPRIIVKVS